MKVASERLGTVSVSVQLAFGSMLALLALFVRILFGHFSLGLQGPHTRCFERPGKNSGALQGVHVSTHSSV
jgi:hypothetical protein